MKLNNIDIDTTLKKVEILLKEERELSPAMKSMVEMLVLLITLLASRLNLNSSNSSKPPSSDPNRKKVRKEKGIKKAGGQKGHVGVTKAVQHGTNLKAHAVYMSQFQLIPYNRIQDYFSEQLQIPVSGGSIYNFNQETYGLLEIFDEKVKCKLAESDLAHVDETGININGEKCWLHCTSNGSWTYFFLIRNVEQMR